MLQAAVCDSVAFDALTLGQDHIGPSELNVSRGQVVDAFVIADMIVVLDEGADLPFEIARQVVVVEQALFTSAPRPVRQSRFSSCGL
jgi:hypothetical protein